jgi:hypothetical protein
MINKSKDMVLDALETKCFDLDSKMHTILKIINANEMSNH